MKSLVDKFGAGASVFISVMCPVCYPAVGAALTAAGLGFLVAAPVVKWGLVVALILSVSGLAWSAKRHNHPWPLMLGTLSALGIYLAHKVFFSIPALYFAAAGLVGASIWNFILERRSKTCSRGTCSAVDAISTEEVQS